ncbi:MAG TPA: dynamin family protein [Pirellulales bacterium]|jgi:GTP-binding protein EngB required for normal cell division|nr:dynamin family protein [Pirellulales bacterium]
MTAFNELQQKVVATSFLEMHREMSELEALIAQSSSASVLSQYVPDLSPTEIKVVHDYFARIRTTMLAYLKEQDIPLKSRPVSLRWALQTGATMLSVAIAEMGPEKMRGYGTLSDEGRAQVTKVQEELDRLVDRVAAYLRQRHEQDMAQRLARLKSMPAGAETLQALDRITSRWGLVEFRPLLDSVIQRLESPEFEIAVFGRVSSGKSSLLNHVAGMDVLPVGITPVTAVPTRIVRGPRATAIVSLAEVAPHEIPIHELSEYASEDRNPGNQKHVTDILVRLPSPRLREGVVLIDTPGLGSLALVGAAQTLAYLPRCDLGIVLLDASQTLNQEDLSVLRLLFDAGVPAQVLLSKADMLSPADRQRMVEYIQTQVKRELGADLAIRPVSTVGADERLLQEWFDGEVEPLFDQQRALVEDSLHRKIAVVRESVIAVLETLLAKRQGNTHGDNVGGNASQIKSLLEGSDRELQQAKAMLQAWASNDTALAAETLDAAAHGIATRPSDDGQAAAAFVDALKQTFDQRGHAAYGLLEGLQRSLEQSLTALQKAMPGAPVDLAPIQQFALRGLPSADTAYFSERRVEALPWWSRLAPQFATASAHRTLEAQLGPEVRSAVALYDRQLKAWIRKNLAEIEELYESQAGFFREQARRLTADVEGIEADAQTADLQGDLDELHRAEGSVGTG